MGLGKLAELDFDAVIFDMDGTLIDSTPAVARAWTTWAEEHGVTAEELAGHHGMPSAGVVRKLLPDHRHDSAIDRINALEIDDVHDIVVLPGAADALAALGSARNAIATSCTMPLARARIAAARLVAPSVLVTADQVAHGKPAPDPFLLAAERLGVDPERCLVVEDAPAGLTAGRGRRLLPARGDHHDAGGASWWPTGSSATSGTWSSWSPLTVPSGSGSSPDRSGMVVA